MLCMSQQNVTHILYSQFAFSNFVWIAIWTLIAVVWRRFTTQCGNFRSAFPSSFVRNGTDLNNLHRNAAMERVSFAAWRYFFLFSFVLFLAPIAHNAPHEWTVTERNVNFHLKIQCGKKQKKNQINKKCRKFTIRWILDVMFVRMNEYIHISEQQSG